MILAGRPAYFTCSSSKTALLLQRSRPAIPQAMSRKRSQAFLFASGRGVSSFTEGSLMDEIVRKKVSAVITAGLFLRVFFQAVGQRLQRIVAGEKIAGRPHRIARRLAVSIAQGLESPHHMIKSPSPGDAL